MAGLIILHVPLWRLGKLWRVGVPYLKTLGGGLLGSLCLAALITMITMITMIFRVCLASVSNTKMTLFSTSFDSHAVRPWIIASVAAVLSIALARATWAELVEAWNDANSKEVARTSPAKH